MKVIGNKIMISSTKRTKIIQLSDIVACEGSGNYSRFITIDKAPTEYFAIQLGTLEKELTAFHFYRASKNQLINLSQVIEILHGKQRTIILVNDYTVRVSYRRSTALINLIEHFDEVPQ